MMVQMVDLLALCVFPFLMAYAAASDLFTMTISNRICLALVISFIGFSVMIGLPLDTIGWHLSCGLAMLVVTFILFTFGWIGGGDAKLAAATAVWLGWGTILDYNLLASIIGGVITLFFIQIRKSALPEWMNSREWIARLYDAENGVPYGLALSAAGLIIFPYTEIWRTAFRI